MYQYGMLLSERYEVEKLAGRGHFAEVYQAWDRQAARMVALKIARAAGADSEINDFSKEAGLLFTLQHPHIVRLLDYTVLLDSRPTLVMEYLPRTLRKKYKPDNRKRQRPLPPEEIRQYLQQAASALEYAHHNHIFHRDIKPENMLLDDNGLLKVSDFGLAIFLPELTRQKGKGEGTEGYKAPEGYSGPKSDQYSLGVVVYEGLTGHRPGYEKGLYGLLSRLLPISIVAVLLPVVIKALAQDPDKRHSSVQHFAVAFEQAYNKAQTRSYKLLRKALISGLIVACLLVFISISIPLFSLIRLAQETTSNGGIKSDLTSTVTAANQIYQHTISESPSFSSSLAGQDNNKWQVTTNFVGSCSFIEGVYQVASQQTGASMSCLEQAKAFRNFVFQVDLKIISSINNYGGIIVRATRNLDYSFLISANATYKFNVSNKQNSLAYGSSKIISTAQDQWNQLTVMALGSSFFLYINQQFIGKVSDSSSPQGTVGLSAEDDFNPTLVEFRNVRLWQLS